MNRDCEHKLEEMASTEERPGRKDIVNANQRAECMDCDM